MSWKSFSSELKLQREKMRKTFLFVSGGKLSSVAISQKYTNLRRPPSGARQTIQANATKGECRVWVLSDLRKKKRNTKEYFGATTMGPDNNNISWMFVQIACQSIQQLYNFIDLRLDTELDYRRLQRGFSVQGQLVDSFPGSNNTDRAMEMYSGRTVMLPATLQKVQQQNTSLRIMVHFGYLDPIIHEMLQKHLSKPRR